MAAIAVVRVRGHMRLRQTIEDAMRGLRLTRVNHCVVVPDTPEVLGMVRKAKDYLTWGPVSASEIEELVRTRGRLLGDRPITDEYVREKTKLDGIQGLAAAMADGQYAYSDLEGVKPLFRLAPPRKGFKGGIKRSVQAHGSLGHRGRTMPELLKRMI